MVSSLGDLNLWLLRLVICQLRCLVSRLTCEAVSLYAFELFVATLNPGAEL